MIPEREATQNDISVEPTTPPRRWLRRLRVAGIGLAGLVVVGYVAIGWYVSGKIIDDGLRVTQYVVDYDTDVLSVDNEQITIRPPNEPATASDRDAVMGLRWETGYGQIGPATSIEAGVETRPLALLRGELPLVGENVVDFDSFAYPDDPAVLGLEYEVVSYPIELGEVEAWLFPGSGETWIVAVHGNAADRTEYLRLAQALDGSDYPILVIRYRNDPDSPHTGDSLVLMGQEEDADVEAAVDYALARGASDVVVYGTSMGGALTLGYALEETRDVIRGLILEAPVADLREVVRLRSGEALPIGGPIGDSMLAVGRLFVTLRTGLDFDQVDYVDRVDDLETPILLFHGAEDPRVPVEISQNLAAARPDLVEFHQIENAAHIRAWNEGPEEYARTLATFLDRIASQG